MPGREGSKTHRISSFDKLDQTYSAWSATYAHSLCRALTWHNSKATRHPEFLQNRPLSDRQTVAMRLTAGISRVGLGANIPSDAGIFSLTQPTQGRFPVCHAQSGPVRRLRSNYSLSVGTNFALPVPIAVKRPRFSQNADRARLMQEFVPSVAYVHSSSLSSDRLLQSPFAREKVHGHNCEQPPRSPPDGSLDSSSNKWRQNSCASACRSGSFARQARHHTANAYVLRIFCMQRQHFELTFCSTETVDALSIPPDKRPVNRRWP